MLKDLPRRLINSLKNIKYRLAGSYLTEMSIPPSWNYTQYLKVYGEVGWLFGAVSLIANSVADSQWHLFARNGKEQYKEIDEHPLLNLFYHINPFQTGYQFRLLAQMYISLVGECFIVLDYNQLGVPVQMWLAPPGNMHVIPDASNYISHYEYKVGFQTLRLERAEVIHIMDPNPANPYRGLGAAHSISADLDSERYASQYQRKLFYNDARPGLVVEVPGDQPPAEEREQMLKQWNTQFRGWGKAYSTAFLWGGAKINNVTMTNRDLDFKELRKVTKDIILAAYHIPESLIGATDIGSRARAEADEYIFAKYTLKPALQRFKEAFNEQLCPLFDEKLEFNFDNPVPEDRVSLVDEIARMVGAGIYTREFALGRLGYSVADMKGGTYLMPMAIIPEMAKAITKGISRLSEEQKDAHWRIYAAQTEAEEKPFIRLLKKLFEGQREEVVNNFRTLGNADFNEEKAIETFAKSFQPIIQEIFKSHMRSTMEGIRPQNPHTESLKQGDDFLNQDALEWIKSRSLSLAQLVNGTTKAELRKELAAGFQEGEGMQQIAERIMRFYKDGFERRAPIVARTEVISASAEGTIAGYERENVQKVEFFAALDERICPICLALHRTIYFVTEASGIITGQTHPQCRCVWLPVI